MPFDLLKMSNTYEQQRRKMYFLSRVIVLRMKKLYIRSYLNVPYEYSDQIVRIHGLIWIFASRGTFPKCTFSVDAATMVITVVTVSLHLNTEGGTCLAEVIFFPVNIPKQPCRISWCKRLRVRFLKEEPM